MFGIRSFAVLASATILYTAEALPTFANGKLRFYHSGPGDFTIATVSESSISFPTLSPNSSFLSPHRTAPYGFTGSGFIPITTATTGVTGSGYAAPTASGYVFPSISMSFPHHRHTFNGTQSSTASATGSSQSHATTTSQQSFSATATPTANVPDTVRGVNIGNWLVLEQWMDMDNLFSGNFAKATDQWSFDSTDGAEAALKKHWDTYFTEDDVKKIASWGINALRIPIGYWAYDNSGTPYIKRADDYLEKAVGWARNAGLKVLVDCHGSPGSQNGYEHSGKAGTVSWQTDDNLDKSITILETMAKKYGSMEYADVVYGLELVNEPISWDENNFDTTKEWAQKAYKAVRSAATNKDLLIVMHDGFMGPSQWEAVGEAVNGNASIADAKFAVDTHLYQNQDDSDKKLTQAQHITKACGWTQSQLLPPTSQLPVYVGEFSAATDICAYTNGTTVGGTVCTEDKCQCSANVDIQYWNQPLIEATRKFVEAELDAFEHSSNGWFMWSYKGPGAWGLDNAVKYGLIGEKVTDRMFPGQCSF